MVSAPFLSDLKDLLSENILKTQSKATILAQISTGIWDLHEKRISRIKLEPTNIFLDRVLIEGEWIYVPKIDVGEIINEDSFEEGAIEDFFAFCKLLGILDMDLLPTPFQIPILEFCGYAKTIVKTPLTALIWQKLTRALQEVAVAENSAFLQKSSETSEIDNEEPIFLFGVNLNELPSLEEQEKSIQENQKRTSDFQSLDSSQSTKRQKDFL